MNSRMNNIPYGNWKLDLIHRHFRNICPKLQQNDESLQELSTRYLFYQRYKWNINWHIWRILEKFFNISTFYKWFWNRYIQEYCITFDFLLRPKHLSKNEFEVARKKNLHLWKELWKKFTSFINLTFSLTVNVFEYHFVSLVFPCLLIKKRHWIILCGEFQK